MVKIHKCEYQMNAIKTVQIDKDRKISND